MEEVLCIAVDNNPTAGTFLVDAGLTGAAALSQADTAARGTTYKRGSSVAAGNAAAAARSQAQKQAAATVAPASGHARGTGYGVGTPLLAATGVTSGSSVVGVKPFGWDGAFSVPAARADGTCSASGIGGAVGYMEAAGRLRTSCALEGAGGWSGSVCDATDPAVWATNLYFATTPDTLVSDPLFTSGVAVAGTPGWVKVGLGAVLKASLPGAGGVTTLVPAGPSGTSSNPTAALAALAVSPRSTSYATLLGGGVTPCSCKSAVTAVTYRVVVSQAAASIVSVTADVTIADIQSSDADVCAGGVSLPFAVSVAFVADPSSLPTAGALSAAANSLRADERSGNPGYFADAPVLAGVLLSSSGAAPAAAGASDMLAVARAVPDTHLVPFAAAANATGVGTGLMGLSLRGPSAAGACVPLTDPTTDPATDTARAVGVGFGQDLAFGCALDLAAVTGSSASASAYSALATLCSGAAAASHGYTLPSLGLGTVDVAGYPGYTSSATGFQRLPLNAIGMFGNADSSKAWEWVTVSTPSAPSPPTWDAASGTCYGVVTGFDLELVTATVGEARNPQSKIVAARVKYATENLRVPVGLPGAAAGATKFHLRTTVTWTPLEAVKADYVPPIPPVVPPLPADLFYPFVSVNTESDAANTVGTSGAASAGLSALAAAAVVAAVMGAARARDD